MKGRTLMELYSRKDYRDLCKIDFPPFESPEEIVKFRRGGQECKCECTQEYIPRNVLLLRLESPSLKFVRTKKEEVEKSLERATPELVKAFRENLAKIEADQETRSRALYEIMVNLWESGNLQHRCAFGTCQLSINTRHLKSELKRTWGLRELEKELNIKSLDNKDCTKLEAGDVLLTRIGSKRSVGKPYLIKKRD